MDNKSDPKPKPKFIESFKKIFALGKTYRKRLIGAILLSVTASLLWLAVPLGLRKLLDAVFVDANRTLLNELTIALLVLFILQSSLSFFGSYLMEWVGERVVSDLRQKLYSHLHSLSLRFFADQKMGDITSRLTNDVGSIRHAVTSDLSALLTQSFSLIGSVVLMWTLNWRLSLIIFMMAPLVALSTRFFGQKIRTISRTVQDKLADSTAAADEALSSIHTVKSFAREDFEVKRYNRLVEDLFQTSRRRSVLSSAFWTGVGFLFMTGLVTVFWYGGTEVLAGRLTTGDLVAFIFYAFNIARSIGGMSQLYTSFNSAAGASERIFELLETDADIKDKPGAKILPKISGEVNFESVSFGYLAERETTLTNLNFEIKSGEKIAVIGPSGAGKTTLLHLIMRFYDVSSGKITVDGTDIRDVSLKSLREQIGLVPQDIQLFGLTVRENIAYGRIDASDDEIVKAAIDANAHEFIQNLPQKYDTLVGERGVKLSGGQRQRIAIARALLKDPSVLLLDEATSSLDSASEALVQQALEHLMKNRTSFIVAHRLSTILDADRILVLVDGKIVQIGNHSELINSGGLYKELYEMQFRNVE